MAHESTINNVSDTSFWVAYYRALETERPNSLFQDPFAQRLVGKRGQKISEAMPEISRYTQWSVVARTVIIDRFIEKLINEEGVDAVINLGAGLDARPYRMNLPANLEWVEVDYPHIIAHKSEILRPDTPKCKLTRVELDLADSEKRKAFLQTVLPQARKVLILTEGVIPYLTPQQVGELSKDLISQQRFAFWITEYFHPRVYRYLKTTVRSAKMKNAPFQFYPEDWFGFFRNLGWTPKELRFTGEIAKEFKRQAPMPRFVQLIFPLLPRKVKEESGRMAGFVIFQRAGA